VQKFAAVSLPEADPQKGEIWPDELLYLTLPYFTSPYLTFFFLSASTANMAQPICTHDDANDVACCKRVPFRSRVERKLHFGVKTPQKVPKFGTEITNFLPNEYTRTTFEG
jgi:hypothetical protein